MEVTEEKYLPETKPQVQAYCGVCGEKATGHYYYGGLSCFSCRTFFRRCVFKSTLNACADKNCDITESTRATCQSCRFQKCLSIGMDPDLVSPGHLRKLTSSNSPVVQK